MSRDPNGAHLWPEPRAVSAAPEPQGDTIRSPKHYTTHVSGVECIQIAEHMTFNLGNALKYIWRCDLKGAPVEDLRKAIWYLEREVSLRRRTAPCACS
ncbi:MAG: DUF3310 domain-containing protein [Candidatus Dormibacteria bacterium]